MFVGSLSVSQHPQLRAAAGRGIRPAPRVLGNGPVGDAEPIEMHVSAGRRPVYRGDAVHLRGSSRMDHGTWACPMPAMAHEVKAAAWHAGRPSTLRSKPCGKT